MFDYDCPNCGNVIRLVSIDGQLEGVCKGCGLEISIEKEDWIESLKNKLNLI